MDKEKKMTIGEKIEQYRTPLHRQVLEDIHTYGCKELWWERFSLNFSNPIFSRLYLWIRAVVTMLKKIKRSLISI